MNVLFVTRLAVLGLVGSFAPPAFAASQDSAHSGETDTDTDSDTDADTDTDPETDSGGEIVPCTDCGGAGVRAGELGGTPCEDGCSSSGGAAAFLSWSPLLALLVRRRG